MHYPDRPHSHNERYKMNNRNKTTTQLSEFLTNMRQLRRDGRLSESMIFELDLRGISWVDFNSTAAEYRDAVAERLDELDIDDSSMLVEDNRELVADLQGLRWQPFEVAEAAVAGHLN